MTTSPSVVIAGGGPSGLVAAILLGKRGIPTTVVERSSQPDSWSTKSYSIVLGERGLSALETAGCLQQARNTGMKRDCIIFHSPDGSQKVIPKQAAESLGFSRPLLVTCLETIAREQPNVIILKGSGVKSVVEKTIYGSDDATTMMQVVLDNGSILEATHVIGADGKWSSVRQSFPDSFHATIHTESSFGVHVIVPTVPPDWRTDGTHVLKPSSSQKFYVIAAPIPSGELSVSIVCYDETLEQHPWLSPPSDVSGSSDSNYRYNNNTGVTSWESEYSARPESESSDAELVYNLTLLLEKELPSFLNAIGRDSLETARINRRVSWVELKGDDDVVSFATSNGRVALIGDAAHAVTPSMGEGCNLAMESAVNLVESISSKEGENEIPTVDDVSKAFVEYGKSRPVETEPIQQKSAIACRNATRIGG